MGSILGSAYLGNYHIGVFTEEFGDTGKGKKMETTI